MSSRPYFDSVASQWDSLRASFFSDAVREKAIAVARVSEGDLAADIGAGTGFVTEGLLRAGARVIAVDESPEMLERLQSKFGGSGLVECRVGEAEHLPLADASVDRVFANMYLHHVEHPAAAIREMVRVLKPGGKVVITDLDKHDYEFLRTEQHDRWLGFERGDIRRWLEAAGLVDVAVDCLDENCCAQSSSGSERASIGIFVASGTKQPGGN